MKSSKEIRKKFLDFFASRNHPIIPSDSLIPSSDPSLLFTSAGMVQFKDYFAGKKQGLSRAASCQKCFRTTDLDKIGLTSRHLSFFEMLGNFSFGDYFKKEAIAWGWEFLTKEMNIPSDDRLYVTVYKDDSEAYDIWKKIVPEKKIYRLGDETNFWNMGPTGPCGPCSEIVYDTGELNGCGKKNCDPSCDCARWLEIWNLVFTQFNRLPDGKLEPLPRKNIDTGMGLERLVMVLSGASDVFDTDLFKGVIARASDEIGDIPADDLKTSRGLVPLRLIADHARAALFLLSDGIMPSNEGRGYVLRRMIRRAQRFARLLGHDKPFLYKIISSVMDIMSPAYPEIVPQFDNIAAILKNEEIKFLETLDSGLAALENILRQHNDTMRVPGADAFNLYQTYGFPYDLTKEICAEKGFVVDDEGFSRAQEEAREISRASWKGISGEVSQEKNKYDAVAARLEPTHFVGYETLSKQTAISAIIFNDGRLTEKISAGEEGEIFLKETPFYAESGGQVSDMGELIIVEKKQALASVKDVRKISSMGGAGFIFSHKIKVIKGDFSVGDIVVANVDAARRKDIARHHTSTHLLHKALRKILGETAVQSGSLVAQEYLRFDFAYQVSPSQEQLEEIEDEVNEAIRANLPVYTCEEKLESAKKRGAVALFGEKYQEVVRSVEVRNESNAAPYSLELCGGTHVSMTGEIGFFKIIQESSVGSGIRRITAVSGQWAAKYARENEHLISEMTELLKSPKSELMSKISRTLAQLKEAEKKISAAESKTISAAVSSALSNGKNISGVLFVCFDLPPSAQVGEGEHQRISKSADIIISAIESRKDLSGGIALVMDRTPASYSYAIAVSEKISSQVKSLSASEIAKIFAKAAGGSGGGKATFARGGGKDVSKIPDGIGAVENYIRSELERKK